jgi:hypothetical protein
MYTLYHSPVDVFGYLLSYEYLLLLMYACACPGSRSVVHVPGH